MQTLIFSVGLSIFYAISVINGAIPWWFAIGQAFLAIAAFAIMQALK